MAAPAAPQIATPPGGGPVSPKQKAPGRRATLLDNLFYPVGDAGEPTQQDQVILRSAEERALFHKTPENTHLDLGKDKNELEMLLEKFQPEFVQMVPALCDALNAVIVSHTLASRRKSVLNEATRFTEFETSSVPDITLEDYLWRIVDYCYISPTSLILACILIDKLIVGHGLILSQLNCFKLLFTSVRVASKVHELRSLSNKNFAVVGGVTAGQLNQLESTFVALFSWCLWVEHEEFVRYCERLCPPGRMPRLPKVQM
eukprot:TRINITY_DN5895_c4_g1_i1.p1 TRINITY_DN5895_c4_g1~~TRINITY_DN5895_c4_g1_i1.p1  ORF type:complete len:294 (+),score=73.93 TRINITY_DN5895_c4_g1_i1:107-883(+)